MESVEWVQNGSTVEPMTGDPGMQTLVGAGVPACPAGVEEQACWALLPGAGDSVKFPTQGVSKWGVQMGTRAAGAGQRQAQHGHC